MYLNLHVPLPSSQGCSTLYKWLCLLQGLDLLEQAMGSLPLGFQLWDW